MGLPLNDERPGIKDLAVPHGSRPALTREHRGVHEQPVGFREDSIGRYPIPALEQEHVVDHDILGLDDLAAVVPPDRDLGREHGTQAVGGAVGPALLRERK